MSASPDTTELSLPKQGLSQIPEYVRGLTALKKIDCPLNPDLSELPEWISELKQLEIGFFPSCGFTTIPRQLSLVPNLRMLSFKSCMLGGELLCSQLPKTIEWLILTGNRLDAISDNVAEALPNLRKVMLSHNQLKRLPDSMSSLKRLELLRISGNDFTEVPTDFIAKAAQQGLKWFAMAGNPCSVSPPITSSSLPIATLEDLAVDVNSTPLGKGASGTVYAGSIPWLVGLRRLVLTERMLLPGKFEGDDVAVKVFSIGEDAIKSLSDGRPEDEIAACAYACGTGSHGLMRVRALVAEDSSRKCVTEAHAQPAGVCGVVFDVYAESHGWHSLGNPPSMTSCTRDSYTAAQLARLQEGSSERRLQRGVRACMCVAAAVQHLHSRGFIHGDVYAHNTLLRASDGESVLVDLGAAFYVGTDQDGSAVPSSADGTAGLSAQVQRFAGARAGCFRMDVAALGVLVEEVLYLSVLPPVETSGNLELAQIRALHPASELEAAKSRVLGSEAAEPVTLDAFCRKVQACTRAEEAHSLLSSLSASGLSSL